MRVREKLVYKRQCFGGKGLLARGADRLFLGTLGAAGLAILPGSSNFKWILAILGGTALLALLTILDARRFERYWKKLIVQTETRLRRLAFLRQGGEGQPPPGEMPILSLEPLSAEELSARCLSTGAGVVLRLYQQEDPSLTLAAAELGCRLHFCPEIVDAIPLAPGAAETYLSARVPQKRTDGWKKRIKEIRPIRFLLAGALMLFCSCFLPRGMLYRLLAVAATAYGSVSMMLELLRRQPEKQ